MEQGLEAENHVESPGCSWGQYIEHLRRTSGSFSALVDLLVHRASAEVELPGDPQSIERGLRRLARKGNQPGGQYGRWLLRHFEVPRPLAERARWMGQYHSRFSDLPLSICEAQLWLWDRPPICESRAASWIDLGLAGVAMRRRDRVAAAQRLARARGRPRLTPEVCAEAGLLAARLASDAGDSQLATRELDAVARALVAIGAGEVHDCYHARSCDQLAYRAAHPSAGQAPDLERARELYASIRADSLQPFVQFRRNHGLAYCEHALGRADVAMAHARAAVEHAGDGGLVRFRVMAIELEAHIVGGSRALELRERAARLARTLQHEDLLGVVAEQVSRSD